MQLIRCKIENRRSRCKICTLVTSDLNRVRRCIVQWPNSFVTEAFRTDGMHCFLPYGFPCQPLAWMVPLEEQVSVCVARRFPRDPFARLIFLIISRALQNYFDCRLDELGKINIREILWIFLSILSHRSVGGDNLG